MDTIETSAAVYELRLLRTGTSQISCGVTAKVDAELYDIILHLLDRPIYPEIDAQLRRAYEYSLFQRA